MLNSLTQRPSNCGDFSGRPCVSVFPCFLSPTTIRGSTFFHLPPTTSAGFLIQPTPSFAPPTEPGTHHDIGVAQFPKLQQGPAPMISTATAATKRNEPPGGPLDRNTAHPKMNRKNPNNADHHGPTKVSGLQHPPNFFESAATPFAEASATILGKNELFGLDDRVPAHQPRRPSTTKRTGLISTSPPPVTFRVRPSQLSFTGNRPSTSSPKLNPSTLLPTRF